MDNKATQLEIGVQSLNKINKESLENIKRVIKGCEGLKKSLTGVDESARRETDKLIQLLYEGCLSKLEEMDKAFINLEKSVVGVESSEKTEEKTEEKKPIQLNENEVMLTSIITDKYREFETNMTEIQSRNTGSINKNIIDTAHKLYTDLCNENFKLVQELRKQINFFRNASFGMITIIVVLLIFIA